MPKKKTKSKNKSKKKSTESNIHHASVIKNLCSLCLIVIGVFVAIHTYLDDQEGIVGLLIEASTLHAFGIYGYTVLPLMFVLSGIFCAFSNRAPLYQLFSAVVSFICIHQLSILMGGVQGMELKIQGYFGQLLNEYSRAMFGKNGSVLITVFCLVAVNSYLLRVPLYRVLIPFYWIFKCIQKGREATLHFIKAVITEYKKTTKKKSFQLWMIHQLFFRKVTEVQSKKKQKRPSQKVENDELIKRTLNAPNSQDQVTCGTEPFSLNIQENSASEFTQGPDDAEGKVPVDLATDEGSLNTDHKDNEASFTINNMKVEELGIEDEDGENSIEELSSTSDHQSIDNIEVSLLSKGEPFAADENGRSQSLQNFQSPPIDLLEKGQKSKVSIKSLTKQRVEKAALLEEALVSFNVKAKVVNITPGPSVTRYELQPGEGVKISKITALNKDIALKLAAPDVRIEAPIPGKALVGIEVPNQDVQTITLRSIMEESQFFDKEDKLLAGMGKTITGESIVMNLAKMPHVLIAGATGSGKSVCINTIILSILMKATPNEVKFLMIDPKKVELSLYEGIPHLIAPVVTDPNKAAATLKRWALVEMEYRYDIFSRVGVKDINGFNNYVEKEVAKDPEAILPKTDKKLEKLPYIVVIIDELADLMMVASQDVEQTICRLAQMARATGIHLVIATQRPSVNVVTGLIKANVPSRISFYLQSQIDSRTIIDMPGAEKLLGKGDMLYSPVGSFNPLRAQGVFVSEDEVKQVVAWLKQQASPDYLNEIIEVEPLKQEESKKKSDDVDELFDDAKQLIMSTRYASTSYLQRKLRVGYNRAARIMDQLESAGVISEYAGEKKAREIGT